MCGIEWGEYACEYNFHRITCFFGFILGERRSRADLQWTWRATSSDWCVLSGTNKSDPVHTTAPFMLWDPIIIGLWVTVCSDKRHFRPRVCYRCWSRQCAIGGIAHITTLIEAVSAMWIIHMFYVIRSPKHLSTKNSLQLRCSLHDWYASRWLTWNTIGEGVPATIYTFLHAEEWRTTWA